MFRFTIRELVLLTLVVAVGVAWWVDHRRLAGANRRLADRDRQLVVVGDALTQTLLAIHELGIHWKSSWDGKIVLRPTTSEDEPPIYEFDGEPVKPNYDITAFGKGTGPGQTASPLP